MKDTISLVGEVEILLNNQVVLEKKNLIVQVGKNFLASAVINNSTSPFVGMAIGTGTTAASLSDTTLQTESARAAFTTYSVTTNVVSLSNTYAAGTGTGALTEAGIFNNATSGGTMLSRVVFSAVNKSAADTLTINWTITVG
jgi:hypothetical protein